MKFPWLRLDTIEQSALQLLVDVFGKVPAVPPVDLDTIVYDHLSEHEGLIFTDERDLGFKDGDQVLGRTYPVRSRIEITNALSSRGRLGRYRFTLAHELGHWRLHRPLFLAQAEQAELFGSSGEAPALTSLQRAVFPSRTGPGAAIREEWQANRFAIALLVPHSYLREAFEARFGPGPVARDSSPWGRSPTLRHHARCLAAAVLSGQPALSEEFKLSCEAMAIVLETLGYATETPAMI